MRLLGRDSELLRLKQKQQLADLYNTFMTLLLTVTNKLASENSAGMYMWQWKSGLSIIALQSRPDQLSKIS